MVAQRAVAEETGVLKLAELSIILQWDQTHFEDALEMFSVLDKLKSVVIFAYVKVEKI